MKTAVGPGYACANGKGRKSKPFQLLQGKAAGKAPE
jgi:hypothetical protein